MPGPPTKAVHAGEVTVLPKAGTGPVEMILCLRVARTTALRARTQTINALKGLLVTAPAELREQLRGRSATRLVAAAADASALWRSLTSAAGVPLGTVTSNSTRNSIGFSSCPCLRLGGDAAS
jgi:hypothetical protein